MRVWMVSPELAPVAKAGGLADVVGALPEALFHVGQVETAVVLPEYGPLLSDPRIVERAVTHRFRVWLGPFPFDGALVRARLADPAGGPGIPLILVRQHHFFGSRPHPYGERGGTVAYHDQALRFAFFNHAVLIAAQKARHKPDLLHLHDWQAGLVPLLMPQYGLNLPTVLTLHNLGYQGVFGWELFDDLGIDFAQWPNLKRGDGAMSWLEGAIRTATAITTVSPTYAREILTPEGGEGLHELLAARGVTGILNGIDTLTWNPILDPLLPHPYFDPEERATMRAAFAAEMGFDPRLPTFGLVSRLAKQKGIDLFTQAVHHFNPPPFNLVVLGTGEHDIEGQIQSLVDRFPERVRYIHGFDEPLAHRVYGGSDFLVVPSRYEPCGLTQMIAMRYGAIPVVRATGGLADSVVHVDDDWEHSTGVVFKDASVGGVSWGIHRALGLFESPEAMQSVAARGMARDASWDESGRHYLELYHEIAPLPLD
ncbi:MAG: hypothetical protein AUJ55_00195 [Proteobacteria bacterium CG1_02_64_396]|nr:MAG: hypothetical protein AUJ55_00195 [Proteobacteria bacterium CG1_02_64_396]